MDDFETKVIGTIERSEDIQIAEEKAAPVFEVCPESELVSRFEELAESIISICGGE